MTNMIKHDVSIAPMTQDEIPSYHHDALLDSTSHLPQAVVNHIDFFAGCKVGFEGYFNFNMKKGKLPRSFYHIEPDVSDVANGIASHLLSVPFGPWYAGWWFGYISAYAYYVESYEWEVCLGVLAALTHALLLHQGVR